MPGAGSGRSVEVRIVPACAANRVAVEAAAQEKVCRLAPERQVPGEVVTEAPADEVPGLPPPVVLAGFGQRGEGLHDHDLVEAVGAQFCANPDRSVTRPRPHTGEARGEAGVVLPALRGHALDGGLRILPGDTARRQLVRQFLARVFAPDQQPQRALRGAGLGPATLRSEEHTSELQSLMRISYAVFCLKKNTN